MINQNFQSDLVHFPDFHTHQKGNVFSIFNTLPDDGIPDQCFSWGIHPWYLNENWEKEFEKIESAKANPNLVAIGECGFDLIKGPGPKLQMEAFSAQAELAKKLGLPIILHCIKGTHLLQEYLKNHPEPPTIIWHGFNQNPQIAEKLLSFPIYFSFGKAILKQDSNAQQCLLKCPLDRIFFETDNSDIPISVIYQQASLLLGLSAGQLAGQVEENWNRISKRKIT
ncbi:TatD family hydrolase [Aquiflexum gelatinilyticum]|uniref:TatD family hydrolase n=1 Tax=Aquiflexum gelatinilyticum TaxID=2961943 RepID=UPI002167B337|nr:TatD family hydrolase [Aquiflexum gelatinilyticum]MCS4435719.1 TatD family hydrolase [Aquiflexum gelatinilyticum]